MPIDYTIDRERKLIFETWTGEIQAADLANHWRRYLADPEVLEIRRTVADLRAAVIIFTGSDLDRLIKGIVLPKMGSRKWTTAIVVDRPAQFGVGRQYQVFADHYSKDSIFDRMADAEKWIQAQVQT